MTAEIHTAEDVFSSTFNVVLGYPSIVLVDMDSVAGDNIVRFYSGSMQAAGKDFEQVRFLDHTLPNIALNQRKVVIWCTGRKKTQTIPDSLADSLLSYVNHGGGIFSDGTKHRRRSRTKK